ncbi:hypothetical protein SDC9_39027 [bioreactor metagenome]|uniref:Uncharacterized protein n=1 Tax=bioreactor metagenome TaxID=1076179 RepID=A0A644VR49_9ZZZZ
MSARVLGRPCSGRHQHPHLVALERQPRRLPAAVAGPLAQRGEKGKKLVALRCIHAAERQIAGLEAFGPGAVRQDDLVAVEQQMQIADPVHLEPLDPRRADQMQRRRQHLGLAEKKLGARAGQQHPVLRRDDHVGLGHRGAKRVAADPHRLQLRAQHQLDPAEIAPADPADRLITVVAGQHPHADRQRLDRDGALVGLDQRAGGKAGHDLHVLDVREGGGGAVRPADDAAFAAGVVRIIDHPRAAVQDQRVPIAAVGVFLAVDDRGVAIIDGDGVAAGATVVDVTAIATDDIVVAGTAIDRVIAAVAIEHVGPVTAVDVIGAIAAMDGVVAGATKDGIVAGAAIEQVIVGPAVDMVVAASAVDRVLARLAIKRVIAARSVEVVIACPGIEDVGIGVARRGAGPVEADQRVVIGRAIDPVDAREHVARRVAAAGRPGGEVDAHPRAGIGIVGIVHPRTAVQDVGAGTTMQRVIARAPQQRVIAGATVERIVAVIAVERVVAAIALDRVGRGRPVERVAPVVPVDRRHAHSTITQPLDAASRDEDRGRRWQHGVGGKAIPRWLCGGKAAPDRGGTTTKAARLHIIVAGRAADRSTVRFDLRNVSGAAQHRGLVALQRLAGGDIALATGLLAQFGEQREDLGALLAAHAVEGLIAGLEALGPGAVGQHHLVAVEHEVDVAGAQRLDRLHADIVDQMLRRDQHLVLLEIKRGALVRDQHAVVGRDHHVAFGQAAAKRAGADQHRAQVRRDGQLGRREVTLTGPADLLDAVVAGQHLVAGAQALDRLLAAGRGDHRAGGEAGHELLDVVVVDVRPLVRGRIVKLDLAVEPGLAVGLGVLDEVLDLEALLQQRREVERVKVLAAAVAVHRGVQRATTGIRRRRQVHNEDVLVVTAIQHVVVAAAIDGVVAIAAIDLVITVAGIDQVVAIAAIDGVIPGLADDRVVAISARDVICAVGTDE